jgi:probable HAF family extracellular repeat protein
MNDCGQIVGAHHPAQFFKPHAYLIADGTAVDLNSQIPPGSEWRLGVATAINDAGQIVGVGRHDGLQHAFLLEPAGTGAGCP